MAIRNRHRVGRYLMHDDESGFVHYDDEMRRIWDGTYRHKKNFETRQPQEFVRARNDPRALRHIRPEPVVSVPVSAKGCIGESTVLRPTAPATHIFGVQRVLFDQSGGTILDEDGNCILEN